MGNLEALRDEKYGEIYLKKFKKVPKFTLLFGEGGGYTIYDQSRVLLYIKMTR